MDFTDHSAVPTARVIEIEKRYNNFFTHLHPAFEAAVAKFTASALQRLGNAATLRTLQGQICFRTEEGVTSYNKR